MKTPKQSLQNLQKTPKPTVTPTTAFYCTDRNALKATLASSAFYGPLTSTYTGGTVGYDNFKQSSANPSVVVNGIGGTLSNLRVRISWQKIDGTTGKYLLPLIKEEYNPVTKSITSIN